MNQTEIRTLSREPRGINATTIFKLNLHSCALVPVGDTSFVVEFLFSCVLSFEAVAFDFQRLEFGHLVVLQHK